MLEKVVNSQVAGYLIVGVLALSILAKFIARMIMGKILREAKDIHHSNYGLMKLIKAKYEHANMVPERVKSVDAFVDKYLYEFRVWGIRCITWQELVQKGIVLTFGIGMAAGAGLYLQGNPNEEIFRVLALGIVGGTTLFVLHILFDEKKMLDAVRVYIVDYLQNVCAHRYTQMEEKEVPEEEEKKVEVQPASEIAIREILEQFLA